MTTPRVAVVTNIPSPHQVELFDAIAATGRVDLDVVYLRRFAPGRHWTRHLAPAHRAHFPPVWAPETAFFVNPTVLPLLRRLRPDALVVSQYSGFAYQAAMYAASALRVPWAFWTEPLGVQGFEVKNPVPARVRPLLRELAFLPARAFARSLWGIGVVAQRQLERMTGRRCELLPYFIRAARYAATRPATPPRTLRLLFIGRLSERKGFDLLLRSFGALLEAHGKGTARLTVCGQGPLRPLLARERERMGDALEDAGFVETEDVPRILADHDVLVAPSRYDGWGMVVPEALCAGLTVIGSRAMGSVQDVLARGLDAPFLHPIHPDDAASLEAGMTWALERRAELPRLGALAAATGAALYDAEVGAGQFAALVERTLVSW